MQFEPVAYTVGDSRVRIDEMLTGVPDTRRVYIFRVTDKSGETTVYRCKVLLDEIIRLNDQEVVEHLLRHRRKTRLYAFKGDAIP